jgi:hypothetical protein
MLSKSLKQNRFIDKAKLKYPNLYDYSLNEKVWVIPDCGYSIFSLEI